MRALGQLLDRLAPTLARLTDAQGTDSFFVMRATKTQTGGGATKKTYAATTATALSGFVSVIERRGEELEQIAAARRVPVIFRRVLCAASVDCTTLDKLTIVARGLQPQLTEIEIVRSVLVGGAMREIVTVEEQKGI